MGWTMLDRKVVDRDVDYLFLQWVLASYFCGDNLSSIPEAFNSVPYRASDSLEVGRLEYAKILFTKSSAYSHAKCTTKVIEDNPWAWISGMIHVD
jgi:hypothetical protein